MPKDFRIYFSIALSLLTLPDFTYSDTFVSGYTRSNGTYVAPHFRSSSNTTSLDNWSTKGNTNPYTGKTGTKNPNDTTGLYPYVWSSTQQMVSQDANTSQSVPLEPLVVPTYDPNTTETRQVWQIRFRDDRICEHCSIVTNQGYIVQVIHPTEGIWPIAEGESLSISDAHYSGPKRVGPQRRVFNSSDVVLEELEQKIFGITYPKDMALVRINRLTNILKANQQSYRPVTSNFLQNLNYIPKNKNTSPSETEVLDEPWMNKSVNSKFSRPNQ